HCYRVPPLPLPLRLSPWVKRGILHHLTGDGCTETAGRLCPPLMPVLLPGALFWSPGRAAPLGLAKIRCPIRLHGLGHAVIRSIPYDHVARQPSAPCSGSEMWQNKTAENRNSQDEPGMSAGIKQG